MANVEGHSMSFEYQESPGVNRTAWLTEAYQTDTFFIHDSQWMVQVPGSPGPTGPFDTLTYLGTDQQQWRAKVHCTGVGGGVIDIHIQNTKVDGSINHDDERGLIILGPDGQAWNLEIDHNAGMVVPVTPGFTLKKV